MPLYSISQLVALAKGTKPSFDALKSLTEWVQIALADIAANGWDNSANPNSIDTARACVTAGSGTAYTATFNPAFTTLAEGTLLRVRWHATSGAAPTFNLDGLGAVALLNPDGSVPAPGDLKAGYTGLVIYNASLAKWIVTSGGGAPPSVFTTEFLM